MSDMFDAQKRSEIMSKVHSSNTTPEVRVRKLLHGMGYRFRLHRRDLPGNPDIVLPKYKTVIFVHGCFWHGCPTCRHAKIRPVANAEYWDKKLNRTLERDKNNIELLEKMGWRVMVGWLVRQGEKLTQKTEQLKQSISKSEHEKMLERVKREYEAKLSSHPPRIHNERGAGRKSKVTDEIKVRVLGLHAAGHSQSKIALTISVEFDVSISRSTVGNILRGFSQPREPPQAASQTSNRQV